MSDININEIRENFVYLHKIMAYQGWTDAILTHMSARAHKNSFFITPFSLLFEEVEKDDLILVDIKDQMAQNKWKSIKPLSKLAPVVNPAGLVIHHAIMEARTDVGCVIHTHTEAGVAVSCLNQELLLLDQMSCMFYNQIAYHDFHGISTDFSEQELIVKALGKKQCLILKNHGLLVVGKDIQEAFWNYYYLEKACRVFLNLLPALPCVNVLDKSVILKTFTQHQDFNKFGGMIESTPGNSELLFNALKRKIISNTKST